MDAKIYVFISYSRKNTEFADRLVKDLEAAGLDVWIDRKGVQYYDTSFDQNIRAALKRSYALVLIATPDSLESDYVQGEIDKALDQNIPLIVLWADGEYYTDTVPSRLTRRTYIDCRGQAYQESKQEIIQQLSVLQSQRAADAVVLDSNEKIPPNWIGVKLPTSKVFAFRSGSFQEVGFLANQLYLEGLRDLFPSYTYGSEWIVVEDSIDQYELARAVLPISYLQTTDENSLGWQDDFRYSTPESLGLVPSTSWQVVSLKTGFIFGVGELPRHLDNRDRDKDFFYRELAKQLTTYERRSRLDDDRWLFEKHRYLENKALILFSRNERLAFLNRHIVPARYY